MLVTLFGSKARVKVLALFMLNPASEFYLREIARRTDLPVRAAERTVQALTKIGLLRRQKRGNSVYYSVEPSFPVIQELKSIFLKTVGLGYRLRRAIAEKGGADIAFVFGSYAKNQENLASDVDVFIVGDVSSRELAPVLNELEEELGREINATVFTAGELRTRIDNQDHFVRSVLRGPKLFLIGDEDALERLAS